MKSSLNKYRKNVLQAYIDEIYTVWKFIDENDFDIKSSKENSLKILVDSIVWKNISFLSEAKRFSEVVLKETLEYPEDIEEAMEKFKDANIVIVLDGVLQTKNGVPIIDILEKLRADKK